LAAWIASEYHVDVLDIHHDVVAPRNIPRLEIVLEWERDQLKFRGENLGLGFYDRVKQDEVISKFKSLIAEQGQTYRTDGLFVCFTGFEAVARVEANLKITQADLDHLRLRLDNSELWTISRVFDSATFFFYTDVQAKASETTGLRQTYTEAYEKLVAPHDEFGYLKKRGIHVYFDSKENLDINYQSNWLYYYR
jgi:hypothetical protein